MADIQKFASAVQVNDFLSGRKQELEKLLPSNVSADKFIRIVLNAVNKTPKLLECTPVSLWNSVMTCAELNLVPNTVQQLCYIIPYGKEAQFQFGYQGKIALARRSGEIASIEAHAVYKGDEFTFEYGTRSFIKHIPKFQGKQNSENLTHVWALVYYSNKDVPPTFEVMSKEEIEKRRAVSKQSTAWGWTQWYDQMAISKLIGKMFKTMPLSSELREQLTSDYTEEEFEEAESTEIPDAVVQPSLEIKTVSENEIEEVFHK